MINRDNIAAKLVKWSYGIIFGSMIFILFLLTIESLFYTYDMAGTGKENVIRKNDSFLLNLFILIALFFFFYFVAACKKKYKFWNVKKITITLVLWTLVLGTAWVLCAQAKPVGDSRNVTEAAYQMSRGDYSSLTEDCYFKHYPFQLGYVLFCEVVIRVFSLGENTLPLQIINVCFLAVTYVVLVKLAGMLFHSKGVQISTAFLLAMCLPGILVGTFTYGNIPGLMLSVVALRFAVIYMERNDKWAALWSALLIGLSVAIKMNNMIFMLALCMVYMLHGIQKRKPFHLVIIVLTVILSIGIKDVVVKYYENRAEITLGDGVPMISWLAMGLGEDTDRAAGWYNGFVWKNFENNGHNPEKAKIQAKENIYERLQEFSHNKIYAQRFFYEKITSQWNEPTYQSLWITQVRGNYLPPVIIVPALMEGRGEQIVKQYMNLYQQFIFVCTLLGLLGCLKRKGPIYILLPLVLLGGFFYHTLFEAKSQYILTYFILMIPLAAFGLEAMLSAMKRWRCFQNKEGDFEMFRR